MKKFILFLMVFSPMFLTAATVTWTGMGTSNDWSEAANWDSDPALPAMTDDVDLAGNTVIVDVNATVQRIYAGGSSDLTVNAGVTLIVNNTLIAADGNGALEIQGNASLTNNGIILIGNSAGTNNGHGYYNKGTTNNFGTIGIAGVNTHGLYVVAGTFTNEMGGAVNVTNVGLTDSGADNIYVDDANSGTLFGAFVNNGTITVISTSGDDGIYVNDDSTFDNNSIINLSLGAGATGGDEGLYVDDGGMFNNNSGGILTVSTSKDHGIALNNGGFINNNLGGTINVDAITDDQIFLDNTTTFNNAGTINLTNGTDIGLYVTDASTFTNTATGEVNVTDATDHGIYVEGNTLGTATIDNSGTITVNDGGASSDGMRLNSGGSLTNMAGAFLNFNNTGADAIQIDSNSELNNSGTITVDGTSSASPDNEEAMELNSTGSTFNNMNGGLFLVISCADDGIEVNNGSIVNNDGAIRVQADAGEDIETFPGFTFNNTANATFAPGSSPGELEIKGDLDLGASTTTFEITGTTHTTEYDRINNTSGFTLTITSATKIILDWGVYVPNVGDKFDIIAGDGLVSGTFALANITSTNADVVYQVNYTATGVEIEITAILPVELVSFSGETTERGSELKWETATEISNEGFDIERSNNGFDWTNIGYVRGNGDSNEFIQYSFLDGTPLEGANYYRLKQNDFDGDFEYSSTILLYYENDKIEFTFSPNPVKNVLTIDTNKELGNIEVQVLDSNGQLLWNRKGTVNEIPFGDFAPGVYFINIISPSSSTIQKIIKN